jgi:general secretion pathway protein F
MNAPTRGQATTVADFIALNEELASLVRARIPIESHLAKLANRSSRKSNNLADRINKRLESGDNLIAAIDAECAAMPATYRAVILAGIKSGDLGVALKAVVAAASRLDHLRHVTLSALLYPLVLAVLVCWLLAIVVKLVVPSFAWIEHTPFRPILWLSTAPATAPILAVVIPCAILLWAMLWWWRTGRLGGRSPRIGLFATLVGSGRIYRSGEAARFAEMLHLLVERGIPLDESLQLAGDAADDSRLREAATAIARDIRTGAIAGANSQLIAQHTAGLPALIRVALRQAHDRSLLLPSLRHAASTYHERAIRAAEWYTEYLPILLTIIIGGTLTIGFTLFILWPYASMLYELSAPNWR